MNNKIRLLTPEGRPDAVAQFDGAVTYEPDETGHITVQHPGHLEILRRMGYRDAEGTTAPASAAPAPVSEAAPASERKTEALVGSSNFPAHLDVGDEQPVQLGAVVAAAHARSALSVDAWNSLSEVSRDVLISHAAYELGVAARAARGDDDDDEQTGDLFKKDDVDPDAKQATDFSLRTVVELKSWLKRSGVDEDKFKTLAKPELIELCARTEAEATGG